MKWFKHLTEAHDDEKLSEVLCIHGPGAYGVFWLIVESIAAQMDKSNRCSAKYHIKKWASIAHVDRRTLTRYLQTFNILTLIVYQECDNFVTIEIPNLLKLRDNYTKDLQVTRKKSSKQEVEVEVEEPKPPKVEKYKGDFDSIWAKYPNKTGKGTAEKKFYSTVKSVDDESAIHAALDKYLAHLAKETWKKAQNGSTWFNNWTDWIDFEDTCEYGDDLTPQQKQAKRHGGAVW